MRAVAALVLLLTALLPGTAAATWSWPDPDTLEGVSGEAVTFTSHSPFSLSEVGAGPELDPPTPAVATWYAPRGATAERPAPAVVLLHGSSGVQQPREHTYARQFAAMGIGALVIDTFAARRDRGTGFLERVLNITEAMMLADAHAGLRWLDARPEIDADRVALIGFSYGGMAAIFAAHAQVAEAFSPRGARFAAHVAFYAPCIARFRDARATGAPLLMLSGTGDALIDPARCAEVAADLEAGGARVETIRYEGAFHQWDGRFGAPRKIGRNLAPCALRVERDGTVRDLTTFLTMDGPLARKVILGICSDADGYMIGRDDTVRARSNSDMARFLGRVFARDDG
ncbi:MAG: dienelactone hydrolase family protein [Alphaproteobacteria bacterium]